MRTHSFHRLACAAAMLLPLSAQAIGISVIINGQTLVFKDVPQSAWFASSVQAATEAGIVNGYLDAQGKLTGRFGPENQVTVAEALKIASESAGYDEAAYGAVVASGVKHWASIYVSVARGEHFPVAENVLRLDRPASRAEVASMIAAAFLVDTTGSVQGTAFTDVKLATSYGSAVEALSLKAVVTGDMDIKGQPTGMFRPMDPINRAEVVKIAMSARAAYGEPGAGRAPSEEQTTVFHYRDDGFTPAVLRVKIGTIVTFKNESNNDLWIASNPHPLHTSYPALDSNGGIKTAAEYRFTFSKIGTWGVHNHLHSTDTATIIVE